MMNFYIFMLPKPTESRHNLTRSLLRRTLHVQESMHISVINVASDHYQLTDCANDPESLKTLNSTILPSFRSTLIMCAKYVSKSFCVILAFPLMKPRTATLSSIVGTAPRENLC